MITSFLFDRVRSSRLSSLRRQALRRPAIHRRKWSSLPAAIESLEDRTLLSGDPANVFAKFHGSISEPGEADAVRIHVTADNFEIRGGHATLGFVLVPAEGSSLIAEPIDVDRLARGNAPVIHARRLDDGSSIVLAKVKHGDYDLGISAVGGTTGNWELQVFLAGDVTGDFVVDDADHARLRDVLTGRIPPDDVLPEGDANRDGKITGYDLARASTNNGISTTVRVLTVTAGLSPASETGVPDDNIVNHTPVAVTGLTLEHAEVRLDEDGDGFDDGTTVAETVAESANYSLSADLVEAVNTLAVEARDSFGQVATDAIDVTLDTALPTVAINSPADGLLTNANVTVSGRAADELSGIHRVEAQLDAGAFFDVTADDSGRFRFDTTLPLDGSADGSHTVGLRATDVAGNVSDLQTVSFTLDTIPPAVVSTTPAEDAVIDGATGNVPVEIAFSELMDEPALIAALSVSGNATATITPLNTAWHSNTQTLSFELSESLTDTAITVAIADSATDLAGNSLAPLTLSFQVERIPTIIGISPANGEELVSTTRDVVVRFSQSIDPATITPGSIRVIANGSTVPGRLVVGSTERQVTFFPDAPWPGSTEIRVRIDGDGIRGANGERLDADGDGQPGGLATADFRTVPMSRLAGTNVTGRVIASERGPGGEDVPLEGVTIRVDGFDDFFAVTDADGFFTLHNAPAPVFFVHIDGSTVTSVGGGPVPEDGFYPTVGKPFHSVPGQTVQLNHHGHAFDIHLPFILNKAVHEITPGEPITVTLPPEQTAADPDLALVSLTVPADSLRHRDGTPGTQVGVFRVDSDRLPAPLPFNLSHAFDITVQADAPIFDTPAPITFPNLDGLAPGEKTLLMSFDHALGEWVVVGTMTVSADGLTVTSDPGVGVRAPGWHGMQNGSPTEGGPLLDPGWQPTPNDEDGDGIPDNERDTDEDGTPDHLDPDDDDDGIPDEQDDDDDGDGIADRNDPDTLGWLEVRTGRIGDVISVLNLPFEFLELCGPQHGGLAPRGGQIAAIDNWETILRSLHHAYFVPAQSGPTGFHVLGRAPTPDGGEVNVLVNVHINVGLGFSGPNGQDAVTSATDRLGTYRIQQRLKYFGFPGQNELPLSVSGNGDANTRWAIGLFNAAVTNAARLSPSDQVNLAFINTSNAPRWINLPASGVGWRRDSFSPANHKWGTSWAFETLTAAGQRIGAPGPTLLIADLSLPAGGPTPRHSSHQAGMDIDVETNSTDSGSVPFYRTHDRNGVTYIAATTATDPHGDNHVVLFDPDDFLNFSAGSISGDLANALPHTSAIYDSRTILASLRDLIVDNPTAAGVGYDLDRVRQQILAFQRTGAGSILYNDPRLWSSPDGIGGFIQYASGHGGHFHVNVSPPVGAFSVSPLQALQLLAAVSDTPGFGTDARLHYLIEPMNGIAVAGRTDFEGVFSAVLPSSGDFRITFYQASTNRAAVYHSSTLATGRTTTFGGYVLDQFGGFDTDGDGLPDVGEIAIGTRTDLADTDGDGIDDATEITQGLDPLDNRGFPTGVVATLPLMGPAREVVVEGSTLNAEQQIAYVATGSHGLAVVDASRFNLPVVLGQLDLPGDAADVAVDPRLGLAVVAAGSGGLHVVDVSDPMLPALRQTINVAAGQVEIADGVAYVAVAGSLRAYDVLTGELLETLTSSGSTLTGLAREGLTLYTMDAARTLRAIDISGPEMLARGSRTLPDGAGKLFVGGGIAYAAALNARGGFATADVSNPDSITLISGSDVSGSLVAPRTAIVTNGSGLGVLIGTPPFSVPEVHALDLMDVSNPANTNQFLTRINLPSSPSSVAIAAGLAFVAGGTSGLHVVNYLPFDNRGHAPTVTIATSDIDVAPAIPGTQVLEGTSIPIRAMIADDVQVRNVELLVNGQVVVNDVSFPFDLTAIALPVAPDNPTTTIQVRATDTGGNSSLSNEIVLEAVPDTFPPMVIQTNPAEGEHVLRTFRSVLVHFNESLDAGTVTASSFRLRDTNGTFLTPFNIQLRKDDHQVQVTFASLDPGDYELVITASAVTDRSGNPMGDTDFIRHFTVTNKTVPDPVSKWLMEGSVSDVVGNNHPSATNAISFVTGHNGQGVTFGSGGYIEIPHSADLAHQRFTIAAWAKPKGPGPNNDHSGSVIVEKGLPFPQAFTHGSVALHWRATDNRFLFHIGFTDGTFSTIPSATSFGPGEFYHVAGTYDGATFRLFVNAALEGELSLTNTIAYGPSIPWTIGSAAANVRNAGFPRTWNGVIDEVAIYHHALSSDQIRRLGTAVGIRSLLALPSSTAIQPDLRFSDSVAQLQVSFSESLQPASVNDAANWELREAGPDTVFGTADDVLVGLTLGEDYVTGPNVILGVAGGVVPLGRYRLSVFEDAVLGLAGNPNDAFDRDFDLVAFAPVSEWTMEGSVSDVVGNNQPSATNAISFVTGHNGQGVTFGSGGNIEIPHSADIAQQRFTIAAWAKPEGPGPNNDHAGSMILAKGLPFPQAFTHGSVALHWRATDNRFLYQIGFTDGSNRIISSANSFAPGEFYHVAGTYDGAVFRLFVNGVLEGEASLTKTIEYDPSIPWTIGSAAANVRDAGFPRTWNGVIDEVGIYDHALSELQIAALAQAALRIQQVATGQNPARLWSPNQFALLAGQAVSLWTAAGADRRAFDAVEFSIADLPVGYLGLAASGTVWIDVDASGHGWFIDATPDADEEFESGMALRGGPAEGRIDLLSVLAHEMGHLLGFDHDDHGVMTAALTPGVRKVPTDIDVQMLTAAAASAASAKSSGPAEQIANLHADSGAVGLRPARSVVPLAPAFAERMFPWSGNRPALDAASQPWTSEVELFRRVRVDGTPVGAERSGPELRGRLAVDESEIDPDEDGRDRESWSDVGQLDDLFGSSQFLDDLFDSRLPAALLDE